jgi:glycerol-3-phosphate cytidylyltransferase
VSPRPPTRVLTIGTFDILHFGHVAFLRECEKLGTEVLVGVNSDRFAAGFKAAPVMTQDERQLAIGQLGYATLLNDGPGADLIDGARPDVLAVGSDWARKDYYAQVGVTQDWLDDRKIIVAWVPYRQGSPISTTEIRRRVLAAGDLEKPQLQVQLTGGFDSAKFAAGLRQCLGSGRGRASRAGGAR